MLTTLSIVSLDQGKIARRHDVEREPASESYPLAASRPERSVGRLADLALAYWQEVSARFGRRQPLAVT